MSPEAIGFVMIAIMLLAIFVGFPISFTLIFLGLVFGAWGFGPKLVVYLMTLQFNNVMLEQTLAAVPLFIFMGILMEQAGLMERLFRAVQLVLSSTRGALYIAVLFVSTIFAAATGIVGASVTILGIMAAKTMNRSGYDVKLAAGTITAGGTLGILIPPSIMLVVMGPVLEVPVTDLFAAAIVPGILLACLYTAYSLIRCGLNPALGPPLPEDERPETSGSMWLEFVAAIVVPVALFIGMTMAVHTFVASVIPGEGLLSRLLGLAAYLAAYAALAHAMITAHRWLEANRPAASTSARCGPSSTWAWCPRPAGGVRPGLDPAGLGDADRGRGLRGVRRAADDPRLREDDAREVPGGSGQDPGDLGTDPVPGRGVQFLRAVFSRLGTPTMLTNALLSFDLSQIEVLIIVMALIFILGWPLEWVPIVLIIVPILIPLLDKMGINLTWFGILVAVNLQTAWLSPPVALSAYFLKGVVPDWDLKDIYLGMMQFMVIQLIGLALIMLFPQIVLWLPGYMYGE